MKSFHIAACLAGIVISTAPGAQTNPPDLLKAKNCLACHAGSTKLVGPSFNSVGDKYQGQGTHAQDKLVKKVIGGGSGAWGTIPMPANPKVSQAEATTMVKWILLQRTPPIKPR